MTRTPSLRLAKPTPRSEWEEQCDLIRVCALHERQYPCLRLLYAIPNGEYRPPITARRLQLAGVRAHVPDLCLPVARGGYHSLYVEMKRADGRATAEQRAMHDALREAGNWVAVCRGWKEGWREVRGYLEMEGDR